MTRYWIAVACREHVMRGIKESICQVCHGKPGPLKQMKPGDWLIYYSPTEQFKDKTPYRKFTAIGKIDVGEPYQYAMSKDFIPWRRDVIFFEAREVAIEPLLGKLSFIKDKQRWGFPFRRGCFEVPAIDFIVIASAMGVDIEK